MNGNDQNQLVQPFPSQNWGEAAFASPQVHINTTNYSAIKMHHILKQLGVENNKFMLSIYDTDLMYINPFSPNLSPEMQHRVHAEIVRNYWYYLREIVRINVPGGVTQFEFHRGNLAISWLVANNINTYVELPRQMTKTGTIAAYFSYIWGFKSINSKSAFLSKDPESVKSNLNDVKVILNNLPPYLQMLDPNKDSSNMESIVSSTTFNSICTRNPPGNEATAINKGRGSREPLQWYDETPHINFIKTIILNSSSSWQQAATFAKANGVPYGRIFSSTPGILGTEKGDYIYYEFIPQCVVFDEKLFYDQATLEDVKNLVFSQSKNDFVYVKFQYRQLGKGEEYYAQQCRNLQNDKETIMREVDLMWTHRAVNSPFTKEQLDRIFEAVKTPIGTILIQKIYVLKLYKKPDWTKKYVLSVDCSGMMDTDYSSIAVTDPETFELVGTLRSNARTNYSNTTRFSYAIIDIARNIFPNAILVIEKNNMGITVIDNIITFAPDLINRMYSSMFEPEARDKNYDSEISDLNIDNPNDRIVYGFNTNANRRNQMFREIIGVVVGELYDVVNDLDVFSELNNVIRNNKGRLDHKSGKHDDMLFAWLIGLWVLCYSKILTSRFGYPVGYIRPMSVMNYDVDTDTIVKPRKSDESIEQVANALIRNQMEANNTRNSFMFNSSPNFSVDRRESMVDITQRAAHNPDGNEICDLVFGDSGSVLDDDDLYQNTVFDAPNIESGDAYEDIQHSMRDMDKVTRNAYVRQTQEDLDHTISQAKNYRQQNVQKARDAKERKKLSKLVQDATDSSSHIDALLKDW